ncbi:hypothetical protein [Aliiroseovarius sp.]|uniref:hypothetical protein n=1 Tax=Aliiroseovarius sp. TaxID=1872442 RepID=UPI0026138E20|nr:hypothetical protein [Aliiroseovarius sp.]
MKRIFTLATFLAGTVALPAMAQTVVGSVGGDLGFNFVREADSPGSLDRADVASARLAADAAWQLGNAFLLGVGADLRWDDFSSTSDFDDDEDPDWQGQLAIHALRQLGDGSRAGVFATAGEAQSQGGAADETYGVWLVGVEGQTLLSDNVLVFGQLGGGDVLADGDGETEGFTGGYVARAGGVWFASDRTAVMASVEHSGTDKYIDSNDPGRFWDVTIAGETRLSTDKPLLATYGMSYTFIDSTDEGDNHGETRLFAGIKFLFGADSPRERWVNGIALGTPVTPLRASAWTEYVD